MGSYDSAAARIMNENFFTEAETPEGRTKLAAYGGEFIRDHLREEAYCRKVMNAKKIDPSDCQVSLTHDTLIRIEEVEPQSRAMSMGFRGEPTARYISAPRFAIGFFTISSEKFEKVEQELLAYRMPITKVIEDNSVKDIQEIEDREFTVHLESMIEFMQIDANGAPGAANTFNTTNVLAGTALGGLDVGATGLRGAKIKGQLALAETTDNFNVQPVQRPDFVNLFKVLVGKRLQPERVLITESDWTDILQWTSEDMGAKAQTDTLLDGYKYNLLLGMKFIRTIKNNILREGNIYVFAAPEFFGYFYILNEVKFYIDKIANRIMWQSWEDIGMGFGNISGVAKLELYSGSVTPTQEDAGFANRTPMDEDALEVTNNRIADGGVVPEVFIF